jgi:ureidoglycolate hydrolase
MMATSLIEILDCGPAGYVPLVDHGEWRVASLRPAFPVPPEQLEVVERHTETDEVFVLLEGKVLLVLAGNGPRPDSIQPLVMEPGKVYNVRRDTWHTALLSRDSLVLVVENRDTGAANTESLQLPPRDRSRVLELWATVN